MILLKSFVVVLKMELKIYSKNGRDLIPEIINTAT